MCERFTLETKKLFDPQLSVKIWSRTDPCSFPTIVQIVLLFIKKLDATKQYWYQRLLRSFQLIITFAWFVTKNRRDFCLKHSA